MKGLYEIDISNIQKKFACGSFNWQYKTLFADINVWDIEPQDDHLLLATDKGLIHFWLETGERVRHRWKRLGVDAKARL